MMSSDSQAMGRVGEVIIRTWQTAHKMKAQRGALPGDERARATTTSASSATSPSTRSTRRIAHGHRARGRLVEVGKLADLVLWKPAFFGVKPDLVLKGGIDRRGADGRPQRVDPDAAAGALPADVRRLRPRARASRRVTFVSQAALDARHRRRARPAASSCCAVREHPQRSASATWSMNDATAEDRGRSRDLRGPRRRRAADLRAGQGAADGAALLPVLRRCTMLHVATAPAAGRGLAPALRARGTVDAGLRRPLRRRRALRGGRSGSPSCWTWRRRRAARTATGCVAGGRRRDPGASPRRSRLVEVALHRRRSDLCALAWHLGNRHLPVEIVGRPPADPRTTMCSPHMLRGMGADRARGRRRRSSPKAAPMASTTAAAGTHHDEHDHH